ncbi:MAG: hypothetical protein IT204_02745 [Fimbriimonadaceae bacterium]|nr:hypothetical protein [Fimbriimonadaceae bacterium]
MGLRSGLLGLLLLGSSATLAAEVSPLDAGQDDLRVWPNRVSWRNSDPWLVAHHDELRELRPRLLVLNFANSVDDQALRQKTTDLIGQLAESTRYHGFEDPAAPAFLNYQVLKYVNLRDTNPTAEQAQANCSRAPYLPQGPETFDYGALYNDTFAACYGFRDPADPQRYLTLSELINAGMVHELLFYWIHEPRGAPYETIEDKQYYDEAGQPRPGVHGWAGNGHSKTMPWVGRSFRITFANPARGIGCVMENYGHALEGMAHSNSIPPFRKLLYEYAEFNLDRKYGLPFNSLYATKGAEAVRYLDDGAVEVRRGEQTHRIDRYVAVGGNVHFPPGGRNHYDNASPVTLQSTIRSFLRHNGPDGRDLAAPFDSSAFRGYARQCPDCMGAWLVYWRQCMPGLDNPCRDEQGAPVRNWWVYLFY